VYLQALASYWYVCTHALCIITSIRGCNIEGYVHEYYSVAKFKKAYEKCVKPITDSKQWPKVDLGLSCGLQF
jgi:hypothetical protein